MKKSEIVQSPTPILRSVAEKVPVGDIQKHKVTKIIKRMQNTLAKEADGVALAAPQIGVSSRIFVVSPKAFLNENQLKSAKDGQTSPTKEPGEKSMVEMLKAITLKEKLVYINPAVTRRSKETKELEEGCLSIRWLYGKVTRNARATVRAYDEHGKQFTRGASGLLAQIFQHETDHLDGVLFVDKATHLKELPPKTTATNHD